MPLTNPNKIVTEERLSEFYGQILPYMGGMPDVLANKFSKGDLYSTDEKMIGCWVDGKPLYQKTVAFTTGSSSDTNINHNISNIDKVINSAGFIIDGDNYKPFGFYSTSSAYISLFVSTAQLKIRAGGSDQYNKSAYATIQYTKTTDSPIAIGSDTDYSTDEKIVGTWIDGSPVWQKTVATGGNVPSGATLILRTAMASTGYDTILYTKTS